MAFVDLLLSPVLPFIVFYFQGRKVNLRAQFYPVIISLYLAASLGMYIGRLMGVTAIAYLSGEEALLQDLQTIALMWIPGAILGSIYLLFRDFTALSIGYFRKQEAASTLTHIQNM